jgi:hypothetical protein
LNAKELFEKYSENWGNGCPLMDEEHFIQAIAEIVSNPAEVLVRQLPESEWERCPNLNCNDNGYYPVPITRYTYNDEGVTIDSWEDCEQEQCEFCYTNPKSIFNQKSLLEKQGQSA